MTKTLPEHQESDLMAFNYRYSKSLRMMIFDRVDKEEVRDSFCWKKLERLYYCLPRQCLHPEDLYSLLIEERARTPNI